MTCDKHEEFHEKLVEISATVKNIEANLLDNKLTNRTLIFTAIGIFFTILVEVVIFSSLFGGLNKQVEINTEGQANMELQIRINTNRLTAIENRK
jgi:hypothetical protein